MKNVRRFVALVIIMCLVSSFSFSASASEVKTNTIDGMDRYFTLTKNGTISFDTEGALAAGYTESAVGKVLERINFMNGLVLSGKAYINADFNAVEGQSMARYTNAQIVHNWDGTTDVYLTMEEAQQLLDGIDLAELGLDYFSILAEFPKEALNNSLFFVPFDKVNDFLMIFHPKQRNLWSGSRTPFAISVHFLPFFSKRADYPYIKL